MKLAVAMCAPGPGLFGPVFAVPRIRAASPPSATRVIPGGCSIQVARASSSVMSGS